ncbi:Docosahexaenoic acid omega-hydroxylase CYP4F3 [Sparassis crispa]|uniref:Docosahexaenoic acid omega-hydroxylase CYP4F3 n=1 Tax=Sparassis crispa TaxID=139825 RepID=A0A401GPA0_9APHY|nr:Docosahexaenoic acid omega-hydroxylase CYP4F3 [Sparassis crispa]GBE84055.1 Docosahexaenoic acid omega-hydroxylase CYP4F3 [Sparassis crispa]
MLYVSDPKALHSIIVKDQYVYEETPTFLRLNRIVFGTSLISTLGEAHRTQRKMLNPVFSIAHMRYMLPIFYNVANKLGSAVGARVADGPQELDMLGWMGRTALELIGQGGLGYSFDPLVRDKADAFGDALKMLLPTLTELGVLRFAIPFVVQIGTPAFRRRLVEILPSRRVRKLRDVVDTMDQRSRDIFDARKAALKEGDEAVLRQVGQGKDIMSILIKANMETTLEEDRLPEEELVAQMSTFIFAASDTTSNTLARILHLLAQHQDIQDKLRQELLTACQSDAPLSYDRLMQLSYLDAVCRETLRVHPPATMLDRQARKDMMLPLSEPIRGINGQMMSEIPVPEGTKVFVGVVGSNLNKALWGEDALEWKPERWLSPLPNAVTEARIPGVFSNLMTFLGGSRACLGFKFSEMEMSEYCMPLSRVGKIDEFPPGEVVLAVLVPKFTFELTAKPIVWNMAPVRYPTVGKESVKAEMPLKVGLFKKFDV